MQSECRAIYDLISLLGTSPEILRKRLERHLTGLRQSLLVRVGAVLHERPFQDVVSFVAHVLSFSPLDRALEVIPNAMDSVSCEAEFLAIEFACFEELIQEGSAIALQVAIARHESGHPSRVFNRDLDEFTILQEGVHAGVIFDGILRRWRLLRAVLTSQARTYQQKHYRHSDEILHYVPAHRFSRLRIMWAILEIY